MSHPSEGPERVWPQWSPVVVNVITPQVEKAFLLPCLARLSPHTPVPWDHFPPKCLTHKSPLSGSALGRGPRLRPVPAILVNENVTGTARCRSRTAGSRVHIEGEDHREVVGFSTAPYYS